LLPLVLKSFLLFLEFLLLSLLFLLFSFEACQLLVQVEKRSFTWGLLGLLISNFFLESSNLLGQSSLVEFSLLGSFCSGSKLSLFFSFLLLGCFSCFLGEGCGSDVFVQVCVPCSFLLSLLGGGIGSFDLSLTFFIKLLWSLA